MTKTIAVMLAALAAGSGYAGESATFRLDTMDGPRIARAVETIAYSTDWNGGDEAEVAVDDVVIKRALSHLGPGDVVWNAAQSGPGTHTLTHTCGGETLTAVFEVVSDVVVHFNANGGVFRDKDGGDSVSVESLIRDDGAAIGELPTAIREGYDFAGWFTDAEGGSEISGSTVVTGNVTYYAHWTQRKPQTYTIIYNVTDGEGSVASQTCEFGEEVYVDDGGTLHWEGHCFAGWAFAPDGDIVYRKGDMIAEPTDGDAVNLYAKWSDVVVHFDANGGWFVDKNGNKVTQFDQYFTYDVPQKLFTDELTPLKPDKNGNQFLGWVRGTPNVYPDSDIVAGRKEETFYTYDGTETTYYAVWSHTVKVVFCNNGDELEPAALAEYMYWRVDGNLAGNAKPLYSGESAQVGPGLRTVKFFLNGDKYKSFVAKLSVRDPGRYVSTSGSMLTLNASNNFQDPLTNPHPMENEWEIFVDVGPQDGQKCSVWFECASETVPGQTFNSTKAITLTYYGPDGKSAPAVLGGFSGNKREYDLPWGVYKVDGESQDGKWVSPGIKDLVLSSESRKVFLNFFFKDSSLMDVFVEKITLDACGGTVGLASLDVYRHYVDEQNVWMEIPQLPMPENDGYEFRGWWTQKGGKGRKVVPGTKFYGSEVGNKTLYAHWETFWGRIWDGGLKHWNSLWNWAVKTASIDGTTVVTLTSDVSGTIEIPDNISALTIDLNGHSIVASGGAPGESVQTRGEPAIRIVRGDGDGGATKLVIVDMSKGAKGQIVGFGASAGIAVEIRVASDMSVDVGDGVSIFNGDGSMQSPESSLSISAPVVYETVDGAASAMLASEYNGYLYDANSGGVKGTIQVKIGKPAKNDGAASVKATVQLGVSKVTLKAVDNGKTAINSDGPTTMRLVGGESCEVTLGAEGLSGSYGPYQIDGARNFFTSKDKGEQGAANGILEKWIGPVNVVWSGGNASVSIGKKGKAKAIVTLADGTKATANAQLLVGEEWLCVPVVVTKKMNLAFTLWLPRNGGAALVDGLSGDVVVGKPGALRAGAKFGIDAEAFSARWGQRALPYLPDGMAVTQSGAKWVVAGGAKAGKVAYRRGTQEIDEAKLGDNPSGLKLTYKAKDGSFKGSFKVYADNGVKLKATTVNVFGIVVGGVGYGTATIKKVGSVPIEIQ